MMRQRASPGPARAAWHDRDRMRIAESQHKPQLRTSVIPRLLNLPDERQPSHSKARVLPARLNAMGGQFAQPAGNVRHGISPGRGGKGGVSHQHDDKAHQCRQHRLC
jgi:hypothetical protein